MAKPGGYVVRLTKDRYSVFEEAINEYGWFAEAVPAFTHSRNAPLVCFVVDPSGDVSHIARGRRGVNAGTKQSRLNIEDVSALSSPLNAVLVTDGVPGRNRKAVRERFQNGGLLSPRAFEETVDLLARLAPETRRLIKRFSTTTRQRIARLSPEIREGLAYQKEALAGALNLAGIDRSPLSEWELMDDDAPGSFLEGLSEVRMREDPMVMQDMRQVPGYEYLQDIPNAAAAVFADGKDRLTVIMANRQPLEAQTGSDLIYYNQRFKAFIMVQYKAMEPDDDLGSVFRFPNTKLTEEIERMDEFLEELSKVVAEAATDDFRLNANPFFLKFCPRIQFDPDSTGLTKGMYIPHSYWKLLELDDRLKGPRGGRRLAYSNVSRYLDNTSFAMMVKGAWVGTTIPQSNLLEMWMREIIASGRSITFAVKPHNPDPDGDGVSLLNPNLDLDGKALKKDEDRVRVAVLRR
ncbi:hypothetical protein [Jannaschia donghaensis]|uniref:Uncharacterized protein n=1 Tax=Jannaschia donghaensis TaxID=420998 RepID=A0A0M6YNY7_9RHOB|nr:hypothetical protein [Jannaschia donghaensis]CTQ50726.1 hypothetical protein JDO7802_02753 [Jannaschia donghaensis]